MKKDAIVQFVCFDTNAGTEEFIVQWEQYNKMVSIDQEVILQQATGTKNTFNYVSQHWCVASDFQFVFKKGKRSAHSPELEMRVKEAGGYTQVQTECKRETDDHESKLFVFISAGTADLEVYKQLDAYKYLNIYQAYYESCAFTYILEFFADDIQLPQLIEEIKIHNRLSETGIYKECLVPAK